MDIVDSFISDIKKAEQAALYANAGGLVTLLTIVAKYSSGNVDMPLVSFWCFTFGVVFGGLNLFIFPLLFVILKFDLDMNEVLQQILEIRQEYDKAQQEIGKNDEASLSLENINDNINKLIENREKLKKELQKAFLPPNTTYDLGVKYYQYAHGFCQIASPICFLFGLLWGAVCLSLSA